MKASSRPKYLSALVGAHLLFPSKSIGRAEKGGTDVALGET